MQAVRPDMNMYNLLLICNFVISLEGDVMEKDSIQISGSECQLQKLLQKKFLRGRMWQSVSVTAFTIKTQYWDIDNNVAIYSVFQGKFTSG